MLHILVRLAMLGEAKGEIVEKNFMKFYDISIAKERWWTEVTN